MPTYEVDKLSDEELKRCVEHIRAGQSGYRRRLQLRMLAEYERRFGDAG